MSRKERMQNTHFTVASNETNPASTRWRIHVYCPNCDHRTRWIAGNSAEDENEWGEDYEITVPRMRGGCMECCSLVERMNAVVHRPEWYAFRRAMCRDRSVALIAADWLEEQGMDEIAAQLRQDWNKEHLATPKANDVPPEAIDALVSLAVNEEK